MKTKQKSCQQKDVLERMNFLYQASHLMALKDRSIASYYGKNMMGCAKKAVLRIEPNLKRTMCKCCHTPLIPGETARVRLISKPIKSVKWTCLTCTNAKRFPTKKGYKLWIDQPGAVIEILDYTSEARKNVQKSADTRNKEIPKPKIRKERAEETEEQDKT